MTTVYITLPNKDRSVLPDQRGTSNFTVKLAETLSFPGDWECFLVSATIPYTWTNVSERNNTLIISGASKSYEKRLKPGNYDSVDALLTAIRTLINDSSVSITVNATTMRTSVSLNREKTIQGSLLEILGFPSDIQLQGGVSHESPELVDITGGVNSLLVYLSIIQNTYVGSYRVQLLDTIPIENAIPGDIINYSVTGPDYQGHRLNTRSFQNIEVDIRDTLGRSIDFNNYSLELKIGFRQTRN